MVTGIIGKKVGMTQLFLEDGTVAPATVIEAGPCVVVQGKNAQTDGYEAVQIGLVEGKPFKGNKATEGHFKKANVPPTRIRREVRIAKGAEAPQLGAQILCSMFATGERVDAENNLIVVRGAVPGANGGYVLIRKAVAAKPEPQPQLQEKPKKGKK